jgi:vitamin B12 transporter
MGGVINIITKRGKGKPTGFLSAQGGSFYTAAEKAGISGGTDLYNYSLGLSRFDTGGFSAAGKKYGNTENDGYQNTSVNTRLGISPTSNLSVDFIFNYLKSRADLDNNGGVGGGDPNYIQKSEQISFRSQADLALFENKWEQRLGVSFNDLNRDVNNGTDPAHPSDLSRASYHGQSVTIDWQHTLHLHETNSLTLGVERKEENAKSDYYSESVWGPYSSPWDEHSAHTTGYYLQDQVRLWDAWFTTMGVRLDDHSRFGSKTTYRFTSAYTVKQTDTTIKGSYGTAFKAPSLYQLYEPTYGDVNLRPEKNAGWDLGVEQSLLGGKMTMGATYFHNDFDDLINFDSSLSKYKNIGRAMTQGVELTATLRPVDELTLRVGYTYTEAEDKETGLELLRRPRNKVNFGGNYRFLKSANVNLGIIYVGTRSDNVYDPTTYASTRVKMGEYLLVNLAAAYDITKNLQIFGRVDNLFDRKYEEVTGYGTAGISAYGGVKVSF